MIISGSGQFPAVCYNQFMEQIVIAPLTAKDWKRYKRIRLEALKTDPTAFANSYADMVKRPDRDWQEQMNKSLKKDHYFYRFALSGNEVVGMNGAYWSDKSTINHVAEVFGVFVRPDYRRRGIGRQLMETVIDEIKAMGRFRKIKLGVNAQNLAALRLYQSCGLKIVGCLKEELRFGDNYYDEYLLEKTI